MARRGFQDKISNFQAKIERAEGGEAEEAAADPFVAALPSTRRTKGVGDRISSFQTKITKTKEDNEKNVYSDTWVKPEYVKGETGYGRPPPGSKTERRGINAGNHIADEVLELCEMIEMIGYKQFSGRIVCRFGDLFSLYTKISNKVVGMLLRARKHGLVQFEGEMLFQRRDDDVIISLLKTADQIRESMAHSEDPESCIATVSKHPTRSTFVDRRRLRKREPSSSDGRQRFGLCTTVAISPSSPPEQSTQEQDDDNKDKLSDCVVSCKPLGVLGESVIRLSPAIRDTEM